MASRTKQPVVDVLVLHGGGGECVAAVLELCKSLELRASTVLELPSMKMRQEERVTYYIKNCGLPIVVVSFDDKTPGSRNARPNVHDEIARCRSLKRDDLIVLREVDDKGRVEIGTNVDGSIVTIEFRRDKLHSISPALIRELVSRGMVSPNPPAKATADAGRTFNRFLDSMDKLWDDEFDVAWAKLHNLNHGTERKFAVELDKFFQCYHRAIQALVREQKRGPDLVRACDNAIASAVGTAARAWECVADAKVRKCHEVLQKAEARQREVPHRALCDKASRELSLGQKEEDNVKRVAIFRAVCDTSEKYLNKAQ